MATPDVSLEELWYDNGCMEEIKFNQTLKDSWVLTEFPNRCYSINILLDLFKKSKRDLLMNKQELDFYNNLPEEVSIFRGLNDSKTKKKGLSWTINKEKAEWFANRWEKKGIVLSGIIKKENIFAIFLDRGEFEVVVNPYKIKHLEVSK